MAKLYQRSVLAALLAFVPLFAACERADEINGITTQPVHAVATAKGRQVKVVSRVVNGTSGYAYSDFVTPGKSATLNVGKYQLDIPRGAVDKPTRFMMVVLDNEMIGVRLYAFDKDWRQVSQFRAALTLTVPYDDASEEEINAGGGKLRIANVASETDPTILELLSAEVDKSNKTVTGKLTHFSVWSLAIQFSKELSPGID